MADETPTEALNTNLKNLHEEGGGICRLFLQAPSDEPTLTANVQNGDVLSGALLQGILEVAGEVRNAKTPKTCMTCTGPMNQYEDLGMIGALLAGVDTPTTGLFCAMCTACAALPKRDLAERLRAAWTAKLGLNLRSIIIAPGSATVQ